MKIVAYSSADAPPNHAWIARFLVKGGFLPVVTTAASEAEVREKAQRFWDEERARMENPKRRGKLDPVKESPVEVDPLGEVLG